MNKKIMVRQNGNKDCGASCLLSIMRYYGLEASHEEVTYLLKTDIDGTNAYNIINGSRLFGFDGYGIHYTYDEIISSSITFPIISHVLIDNIYHFIVIYKVKKNKLIIMDPGSSNTIITKEYFKEIYLNTSIVIYPVKEIVKVDNHITLFRLIKDNLYNEKSNIIKLFILSTLTIILSIILNYFTLIGIDIILPNYNQKLLIKIAVIFINVYLIRNIFNYYKNKIMFEIEEKVSVNINNDIVRKYFNLPYQFFKTKSTGEIISRLNDLNTFKTFFSQIVSSIFTNILLVLISMIILLKINSKLFIINIIELIIYLFIIVIYKNKINLKSEEVLISNSEYEKNLNESIYGYETNKNINMINEIIKKLEISFIKSTRKTKIYENIMNKQYILKEIIENLGYVLSITLGIMYVHKGIITLGEFMLYNSVISYFSNPIKDILDLEPSLVYLKNIYNRINDIVIMKEEKENKIKDNIKSDIIIENISYTRNLNKLFSDINLKIKYGDKILIYGKSGIGKSTFMKIIMKYLNEYEGNIYFGNVNLKDISNENIMKNITYVSQNSYINNDTLKNNIIYDRNIDEEEYEKVIEICNLKSIRNQNQKRNDFMIEENGFNISGGERQKIILARSLLKESNYLILDEALSEVGVNEEKDIINKIFNYFSDKTVIYISHKKEIIDMFDKKYKIERSKA